MLPRYDEAGASSRVRMYQYLPALQGAGMDVEVSPLFDAQYVRSLYAKQTAWSAIVRGYARRLRAQLAAAAFDAVWVEKELLPWLPSVAERVRGNPTMIVDYDDAVFHRYDMHPARTVRRLLGGRIDAVMTHAALVQMKHLEYLQDGMPPISVIPTCADLHRFRPMEGGRDPAGFTMGYVGSAGTWYQFDAVARAMRLLLDLRPDVRFLLVNRGEHAYTAERLQAAGVPADRAEIQAADHSQMPKQIARMDAGIFFIKPVFSKQASAPTKLGEFLGCGIPCLGNRGVGDMAGILEGERVGAAVASFDDAALQAGLRQLLELCADPGTRPRCVEVAQRYFSLEQGVRCYAQVYQSLQGT